MEVTPHQAAACPYNHMKSKGRKADTLPHGALNVHALGDEAPQNCPQLLCG